MHRDEVVLQDILNAGRLVVSFVGDEDAGSRPVSIDGHGEAVKRLSKEFRAQHSEIPWGLIAGMRDHLIHGYDLVDWDEVWKTATSDVPDLLSKLEALTK